MDTQPTPSATSPSVRSVAIAAGVVLAAASTAAPAPVARDPARPHARLDATGDVVVVPSGERFRPWPTTLPGRHQQFGPVVLHLSRAELDAVRDGAGEWDTEYGAVVNAALPFDSCAAHLGDEGWGTAARSFGDLQARVYVGGFSPAAVRAAVVGAGRATAERYFRPVLVDTAAAGPWARTRLQWDAWYGDYGSPAVVDVYAQARGARTAVVVLMYSLTYSTTGEPQRAEGDSLRASFRWGPPEGPPARHARPAGG